MKYHGDSPLQNQKFQFVHQVVALSFIQTVAPIPDHMFFSINNVIENHTQANPIGISVEDERLLKVHEGQDGSSAAKVLDFIKGHMALFSPLHQPVFSCLHCILRLTHTMDVQLRHTPSELMVVAGKPLGRPELCHSMGTRPLSYCLDFAFIHLNSILGHYMAEINDLHFKELTFLRLKLKACPINLVKTACSLSRCSFRFAAQTIMSSR